MYALQRKSISFFFSPSYFSNITRETGLWREAKYMQIAACKFVPRFYGLFHGSIPLAGTSAQRGIVMDFMERGSVHSLLTALSGPPPWPLAFRMAHQIALGMNFLHARELMHHDLHPNNVLLDENLDAKVVSYNLLLTQSYTAAHCSWKKVVGLIFGPFTV